MTTTMHKLLLLLLCLLQFWRGFAAQRSQNALTHFGNCVTAEFGFGRCLHATDCDFNLVDSLDAASKRQCHSLQRPDLICCPREANALPKLSARAGNNNGTGTTTTTTTTTARPIQSQLASPAGPSQQQSIRLFAADALPVFPYCGTAFYSKIFGGSATNILEFPWTTLLEYTLSDGKKEHVCGASLIAQRWLLTAAHCADSHFVGTGRRLTGARLGEWNQTSNPDCIELWDRQRDCLPPHIDVRIDRILVHPQFEHKNLTNDIALLRLAQPVDWRQLQHVEAVCLPLSEEARSNQLEGSAVDVSGWGRTEHNNELSDIKRRAVLHVKPLQECQTAYGKHGYTLIDSQLCATGGLGVDSCSGDSGGPLTVEAYTPAKDRYVYLAGIVSYGKEKCGETDFPGVYTRVSSFVDWIQLTIQNNSAAY